MSYKKIFRRLHLCFAMTAGLFFVLLGLTGSVLSWRHEIDQWLNPGLLTVSANTQKAPLAQRPDDLQRLLVKLSETQASAPSRIELPEDNQHAMVVWYKLSADKEKGVSRQLMLNPDTGAILGERYWGKSGFSREQIMPTIFHLHHYLLAGETGKFILSIAAIIIVMLSLSGILLWWPKARWQALRQALTTGKFVSWRALNFRLHRAAGFYFAPVFLTLAITGIYFNFPNWITPLIAQIMPISTQVKKTEQTSAENRALPLHQILSVAQQQFPEAKMTRLTFPAKSANVLEVRMRQPNEVRKGAGSTRIAIDMRDASILQITDPERLQGGNLVLNWFFPLHTGEAFGIAGRIFISLTGIMPLLFMLSGIWLWLRRRS